LTLNTEIALTNLKTLQNKPINFKMKKMKKLFLAIFSILIMQTSWAQKGIVVPKVYSNINTENGNVYLKYKNQKIKAEPKKGLKLKNLMGNPQAYSQGISFNFNMPNLNGYLTYGLIKVDDGQYPLPVFRKKTKITNGKTKIDIFKNLSGLYDMLGWEKNGKGLLGYRIQNANGKILYEGKIGFNYNKTKKFSIDKTIVEGPFVTKLTQNSTTIFFTTNVAIKAKIVVEDKEYSDKKPVKIHEIDITGLDPDTKYMYELYYGDNVLIYNFKTALPQGSKKSFTFAYASDSRGGQGGGERNFYGPNYYITKKIMALARYENSAFIQFTGDLVSGYVNSVEDINLQYANWKRCVEPFGHYFPIIAGVGNHEIVNKVFKIDDKKHIAIDNFPFDKVSEEAVFAKNFVNPISDLKSEDGSKYDPDSTTTDFPPYDETVFSYTYGNVAMIVLNSNYLYSPTLPYRGDSIGGNIHAYIMDNQLAWLKKTLAFYEKNPNIDHVFVTLHTPPFPNGGHSHNDMWYSGDNSKRPVIAGKPVDKGIIERRDQILDLVINQSKKTVAFLTGDEHNFNVMNIDNTADLYPKDWKGTKIKFNRPFYQINNGAAGAPYYAQEKLPWSDHVEGFTTQNALVLVQISGKKVKIKVLNPDTLDFILQKQLR